MEGSKKRKFYLYDRKASKEPITNWYYEALDN